MPSESRRPSPFATPIALLLLLLIAPVARGADEPAATAPDSARDAVELVGRLLAPVAVSSHARDSLSRLADGATGSTLDVLEEQIWRRHLEVQAGLLATASRLEKFRQRGPVPSAAQEMLDRAVRTGWPQYVAQLERRTARMRAMREEIESATGSQRLAREAQVTAFIERTAKMYQDLVDALLALEKLDVEVSAQRTWVVERLTVVAGQTSARLVVLDRQRALLAARVQRAPDDAAARADLDVADLSVKRATSTFQMEIALLSRLGEDVAPLQVSLILVTGKLTTAAFQPRVIAGLLRHAQAQLMDALATRLPHWLFQGLLLVAIFAGFRLLADATRRVMRRVVGKTGLSQLMQDTLAGWSARLVLLVGVIVLLRQLGFQVGPMLAGFGIAGVVVGLALQDTLANFAAGAMILAYQPFDVGDIIEAGGVLGTVRKMSLVSTTVVTFDNQTLIVPNKKVWGDVIRNLTAQGTRRVDLTFSVAYDSDLEQVERVLRQVVDADARVLKSPEAIIKLHQLAESSMDFTVRVWARHEDYWDVYWDVTRSVKLAFDRAGIRFPFPQREVHVRMRRSAPLPPEAAGPGGLQS